MTFLARSYLLLYALDAVVSLIAMHGDPGVLAVSNLISLIVIVLSVLVLVFALTQRLEPRGVFILLPIYYFFICGVGVIMAAVLIARIGVDRIEHVEITPELFFDHFPWFFGAVTAMMVIALGLAILGTVLYVLYTLSQTKRR